MKRFSDQAIETFRRIRPSASIGRLDKDNRDNDVDIVFASIQTLSRFNYLTNFAQGAFDYIVMDEFHHAAAATYRRVIDYFEPKFLLGLTATPERMDGGDLLALCQENLVFEASVTCGISADLLCPFEYWGVPDEARLRKHSLEECAIRPRRTDGCRRYRSARSERVGTVPETRIG